MGQVGSSGLAKGDDCSEMRNAQARKRLGVWSVAVSWASGGCTIRENGGTARDGGRVRLRAASLRVSAVLMAVDYRSVAPGNAAHRSPHGFAPLHFDEIPRILE